MGYHPTKQGNCSLYDALTYLIIDTQDVKINEADYISPVAQSGTTPEYVVERVILSCNGEGGEEFLVKWLGYNEPTWEPFDKIKDSETLTRFIGIEDDSTHVIAEMHAACSTDIDKSATYQTAVNSPYTKEWKEAINAELSLTALTRRGTRIQCKHRPALILCESKWVFKVKRNANGSIKKFQACHVAQGFTQRESIDFNETYAPVSKFNTLQRSRHRDLDAASSHVSFLQQLGFSVSEFDTALYIKWTNNTKIMIVAIYMDDLTIFASDLDDLLALKSVLAKRFKMEDMGEISFLLGLQIMCNRSKCCITIGQQKYIKAMMDKFNLNNMRLHHIPMDPNLHLNANNGGDALDASGIKEYQSIIGTLMYLMTAAKKTRAAQLLATYSC
ncbi:DNA-directed DNA polymerase [Powellomyces hirtus]|uniref:DNA-directed DNA polymerase n=1 Tax=Powellomyces hirtus TaxID=109895 RepID=A0A507DMP8_9FUNG|nr:DNA-directed DNA polymerase [Powellomyces hirtus]